MLMLREIYENVWKEKFDDNGMLYMKRIASGWLILAQQLSPMVRKQQRSNTLITLKYSQFVCGSIWLVACCVCKPDSTLSLGLASY